MIGSPIAREHGDRALRDAGPGGVDFSVNLNPYGPCPAVVDAARQADLVAYPESTARAAREAWAETLDCAPDALLLGHGAADLLWHAMRSLLGPGDRCALVGPTFAEAEAAARAAGAEVRELRATEASGFVHAVPALCDALRGSALAYVCAPNNPTGVHLGCGALEELAAACPDTTFVIDQSFLALSDHARELSWVPPDNVLLLRSLTKEFALAGLRVGLLRCRPELAAALEAGRAAWPTSAPAQAAACAAAREGDFVRASWQRLREDRDRLAEGLRALGLAPLPSTTTFQLVALPDATDLTRRLSRTHAVAVRDARSFGLPGYVRLAARPAADRERLLRALARELA